MRRKLAGDRLRCWLSDNEHKRWSGQGTWNRDREKGVENSRERIKSWEIDALVVGCVWELDFPRSSCWSLQLAGEQPQLQADRQLSRSCSKSLLSAGWEGGSSGYGSNWGNCVSLSIYIYIVVMLKNQVAPHQLQAQLHLGRSSKFSFSRGMRAEFDCKCLMFLILKHQFGLVNASMQKWVFSGDQSVCVWEHQGNLGTWKLFKAVFTTLTGMSVGVDWRYCKLGSPLYGGGSDSLPSAFVSFRIVVGGQTIQHLGRVLKVMSLTIVSCKVVCLDSQGMQGDWWWWPTHPIPS